MSSEQFGFYCPNTNTFYYVPNAQLYEELLQQFRTNYLKDEVEAMKDI